MEKAEAARVGIDSIGRRLGAFHRNSPMLGRPLVAISHGRSSDLSSCRPSLPSQPIGPHCTVRAGCGRCQWHASIGLKSTEGGCVADNPWGFSATTYSGRTVPELHRSSLLPSKL